MSFKHSDYHPKFVAAMEALERIPKSERDDHPARHDLMAQAMAYAPEPLQEIFRAKAREMGLLPEPEYYTEDGEPVYTTIQIANHLGISLEEANQNAEKMFAEHPDLASPAGSHKLHRRQ